MLKQLLCKSRFIFSWIIHQICLLCRTIEKSFNYKRKISYENDFKLKNSSTGIVKYIYSHEFDQDILNLHVEIKYTSLHLNKYNILYSHSFQLLPILFYWKHEKCFQSSFS